MNNKQKTAYALFITTLITTIILIGAGIYFAIEMNIQRKGNNTSKELSNIQLEYESLSNKSLTAKDDYQVLANSTNDIETSLNTLIASNTQNETVLTDLESKVTNFTETDILTTVQSSIANTDSLIATAEADKATLSTQLDQINQNIATLTKQISDKKAASSSGTKICYLTIDDGPSYLTPQVLDILDKYNIKATFFVVKNPSSEAMYQEIVNRGHSIGLHSACHIYNKIYASTDAYFADLAEIHDYVYSLTGVDSRLVRMPGGSKNDFNRNTWQDITAELRNRGYIYHDWNVESGDAGCINSADEFYNNVITSMNRHPYPVILCHDGPSHETTVEALPRVIEALQADGWTFEKLTPDVTPIEFGVNW